MSANHWMMFGTFAEQRHFAYPRQDTYHGVIINGNMVAYAPNGIAGFVLTKTAEQRYIVDPQTHAFQHDPVHVRDKEGNLKKSIEKLAHAYGAPVEANAGKRPLRPLHFKKKNVLRDFVCRCLAFQRTTISERMEASEDAKYVDFDESEGTAPRPHAVVAPYFYMQDTTVDRWLPVNLRAGEIAVSEESELPVFAAVVVSQGVLVNKAQRQRIVEEYARLSIRGVLLWIDDLDERTAGHEELNGLLELGRGLQRSSAGKREVINLHGGYFSVLASGNGIGDPAFTGVTHGPEFGEHRSVVPVGGGIPIARYYVPALHQRVRYREAADMFEELGFLETAARFHSKVCGCPACRETLSSDPDNFALFGDARAKLVKRRHGLVRMQFPTAETKLRCLQHYLQRKDIEYNFALTASAEQIREDVAQGQDVYEEVIGLDGVAHLSLWSDVLLPEA